MRARVLWALLLVPAAASQPLEIVNLHGDIHVEVVIGNRLQMWRSGSQSRDSQGIAVSRSPARLLVEALPPENESPHIEVRVPLALPFRVTTDDGDISIVGMVRRADVQSARGSLSLSVPLDVTILNLESSRRPEAVDTPPERALPLLSYQIGRNLRSWRLAKRGRSQGLSYGVVDAQLHAPPVLRVRDWEIPQDWPLRPHTESRDVVARLLAQSERRQRARPAAPPDRRPVPSSDARSDSGGAESVFRSEVRMVNMSVAVSDSGGRPMLGLAKNNFVVEERGQRQDIRVADPEESPFNLAVLLDLSGSTASDLEHMRQATRRLIALARPHDRVALYAMTEGMFHRLTPLTSDREVLVERLRKLPYPIGGSPLWDTILLAYDNELSALSGERNALVVISDGIDNRISGHDSPSVLSASRLIQTAGEMDARIYPIFLLSGERFGRNWSNRARKRMESLAQKTGGRLFTARSVADIEPVLPHLAREMRSVYEIAYYPADQEFDGSWRRVTIKVDAPGAKVRARPGYFAE